MEKLLCALHGAGNAQRNEHPIITSAVPSEGAPNLLKWKKEKLIDLLFARLENDIASYASLENRIKRMSDELQRANEETSRWEQRKIAAEKKAGTAEKKAESDRAAMQNKINRLLTLVEQLRNGDEQKTMTARTEKAEKTVANLLVSGKGIWVTTKALNEALANNRYYPLTYR